MRAWTQANLQYMVEVDPAAWIPVGRLSADSYRRVLEALERIAEVANTAALSDFGAEAAAALGDAMMLFVEDLEVRYVIEPSRRRVRLVDLRWRP